MIVVFGCGNANRGDDGAGPEIIRRLREKGVGSGAPNLRLIDGGTDGMAAMFAARGCRSLIVLDACRSGSTPGAVFELPGEEIERAYEPTLNLHDFRWDHALYAGRRIFREAFPTDVVVLLIEARTVDLGVGLSPAVSAAVGVVAARVEALIADRLAP